MRNTCLHKIEAEVQDLYDRVPSYIQDEHRTLWALVTAANMISHQNSVIQKQTLLIENIRSWCQETIKDTNRDTEACSGNGPRPEIGHASNFNRGRRVVAFNLIEAMHSPQVDLGRLLGEED